MGPSICVYDTIVNVGKSSTMKGSIPLGSKSVTVLGFRCHLTSKSVRYCSISFSNCFVKRPSNTVAMNLQVKLSLSPVVAVQVHAVQGPDGPLLGLPISSVSVPCTHIVLSIELSDYWIQDLPIINISTATYQRSAVHDHSPPDYSDGAQISGP